MIASGRVEAERLGVRPGTLDREVWSRKKLQSGDVQGKPLELQEPEPWAAPINGPDLLAELSGAIRSYVFMSEAGAHSVALWILHTYLVDCFAISPRLAITSPEKGCGKTTLLDVIEAASWRPLLTPSIQPAGIFRVIELCRPTLLIDEADGLNLADNNALRSILNSGHRKGGKVIRCEGDDNQPRGFTVYGACALALIGKLPDTLESRSIAIELRRAKSGEVARQFRFGQSTVLHTLASKARRWCTDHAEAIARANPATQGLFNRDADNWRPLFAIADEAGGEWPALARKAAQESRQRADDDSIRVLLLADIRDIFCQEETDRLPSATIVDHLVKIEGRPWAEWKAGKSMSATGLARLLAPFKIAPTTIRDGGEVFKGYTFSAFDDAFERYSGNPTVTPLQTQQTSAQGSGSEPLHAETVLRMESAKKPNNDGLCNGVTVQNGAAGNIADDDLDIPASLRRVPPGSAPGLGPAGDSLDDFAEGF